MVNCEVNIRNEFFISALFAENMITTYLSEKLMVNNIVDSNLLGNNDYAINFEQKFELLLESEKFSIIDKSKLSVFRAIYLEFLNNKEAESIEECFTSSDNNSDFLLILYPQSDLVTREEKLTNACYKLMEEVSELISNFTKKPEIKLRNRFFKINSEFISKVTFLFTFLFLK